MAGPIAVIITAYQVVSSIIAGVQLFQKFFGKKESSPAPSTLPSTTYPSTFSPSHIITEDTREIQNGNFKQKKESLRNYTSNNRTSSSNPASPVGFILVVSLVLAVIAFIIYRRRTKLQENRFSFRYSENQIETSPSPPTSETEENRFSL